MHMNLSRPYRRFGKIFLWIILIIVLFSLILTTCKGRFFNTTTCAETATATTQSGSETQVTATATGGINTPTPNTSTMRFWRPGVIAVSLKLNNNAQNVSVTDIVSCLNSVLGKGVVSTLKDGTKTPTLITLKTTAVLFLSIDDTQMINIINNINRQVKALSPVPNVTITGASPDWLSIGAPGDYIGGSPGGLPQDASDARPNCLSGPNAGAGQDVYVLDTFAPLDSIPTTPNAWSASSNGQTRSSENSCKKCKKSLSEAIMYG